MSDEKNIDIYVVAEATPGATPATPNWTYFRKTSGANLGIDRSTIISNEMTADGEIPNVSLGRKTVGATLNFELSFGTFKTLFESALKGSFVADTPASGTDQLKGGTTKKTFSILVFFSDQLPASKRYHLYTGCDISQLDLTFPADGNVTGSFTFVGMDKSMSTSAPAGSIFLPSNGIEPMVSNGGTINEGGSSIGFASEISLSLSNDVEANFAWGANTARKTTSGRRNVTANLSAFYDDAAVAVLEKFENDTKTSIDWTVSDPAGNSIRFYIPAGKYTSGRPEISGKEIPITLPVQAFKDATEGTSIIMETNAA